MPDDERNDEHPGWCGFCLTAMGVQTRGEYSFQQRRWCRDHLHLARRYASESPPPDPEPPSLLARLSDKTLTRCWHDAGSYSTLCWRLVRHP